MNNIEIEFFNDFFGNSKDIKLTKQFLYSFKNERYEGELLITSKKGEVTFTVLIPESYPLNDLKFITSDFVGYPHQNHDGSLCLNTPFVNHVFTRLSLEREKLHNYIANYYENESGSEHYEYSTFNPHGLITLIFDENDFDASRINIPFGDFKYSVLSYQVNDKNRGSHLTAFIQNIGNKEYEWSEYYKKKKIFNGCWVFLDKEPVQNKKLRFNNWSDLARILPEKFSDYFTGFCRRVANCTLVPSEIEEHILLAIGYKIPTLNSFEIHWDLASLPRYDFPRKIKQSSQFLINYTKPILWEKTSNACYERFFGRGSLEQGFADNKILIIGTGAIGSSLAEILTRGGAKRIDLSDTEVVEPGNICRGNFNFAEVSGAKMVVLRERLHSISPFIEVGLFENLEPASIQTANGKGIYERISKYDIIFDCTANNEIIQMLTDFQLQNAIFYLSISDKAREMVCVCNIDNRNIIERRNQMLYAFGNYTEASYREGTGCWHPTFEASYFDINQLLNFTVRKINSFYRENTLPKTFYTRVDGDKLSCSEDIRFIQAELDLRITIESSCLYEIEKHSRLHYPKEFGGILVGSYLNGYEELVISDIICPEKYKNSTTGYVPDHTEINIKLKELYKKYDGKIEYLGDWHSHPNSNNHFSPIDFKSIQDVAKSSTVRTYNPILLITSIGLNYFEPGFYVYHNKILHKFSKQ